jgi:hypothetical protein
MNLDELDRILGTESAATPPVDPSPAFAPRLLARLRTETRAAAPPPCRFPWRSFLPALAVLVALSAGAVWAATTAPPGALSWLAVASSAIDRAWQRLATDPHLAPALADAAAALAGTVLVLWLSRRFAGAGS